MAWKDLPAWLKGGIIGFGIIFSIFIINMGLDAVVRGRAPFYGEFSMVFFYMASLPFDNIAIMLDNPPLTGISAAWVYSLIVFAIYFVVGAGIGWIVGKIRG